MDKINALQQLKNDLDLIKHVLRDCITDPEAYCFRVDNADAYRRRIHDINIKITHLIGESDD